MHDHVVCTCGRVVTGQADGSEHNGPVGFEQHREKWIS